MSKDAATITEVRTIINAALRGELTEVMARRVYALGREATVVLTLALNHRIAEMVAASAAASAPGPHTPSGAIPPYAKAGVCKKRRGKPRSWTGPRRAGRTTSPSGRSGPR